MQLIFIFSVSLLSFFPTSFGIHVSCSQAQDDVKKGFIKAEDKSYQLQKLAEQRKTATVT